eukprot:SAG31_NODE_11581_length_1016_cov_1.197383_1_plen_179_part_00
MVTNKEVIAMAREGTARRREMWWEGLTCATNEHGKHAGIPCSATTVWEVVMPLNYSVPGFAAAAQALAMPSRSNGVPINNTIRYYALFNLVSTGPSETRTLKVNLGDATQARARAIPRKTLSDGHIQRLQQTFQLFDVWKQRRAENYTLTVGSEGETCLLMPVAPNSTILLRVSVANS